MTWRLYQARAEPIPIVVPPPPVFEDSWHLPWEVPVRTRPGLGASCQQASADSPPVIIDAYSWRPPFGEPVRQRPGERAGNQQFLAFTEAATQNTPNNNFAEQSYYSKYAYPWSEPVRLKRGLGAHLQQFFAYEPDPVNLIIINDIPWYNWLSNPPIMTKLRLGTGSQPVLAISPYIPSYFPFDKGYVIE